MRLPAEHLAYARGVADAILYEGYLLYPYRQSSRKNQARFQFGVLMPPAYAAVDDNEPSASQTECLAECADDARVEIVARFLHVRERLVQAPVAGRLPGRRSGPAGAAGAAGTGAAGTGATAGWRDVAALSVAGTEYTRFTEAAEHEERAGLAVAGLDGDGAELPFHIDAGETAEDLAGPDGAVAGRLIHRWAALDGVLRVQAERVAGPYRALRLRIRIENRTEPCAAIPTREHGLRYALVAAHSLIGIPGGSFISMTDHPEWASAEIAACTNVGTWPVLAGPAGCRDLMLSSPVILYDHPEIAPESAGDLFDATEIDEILTLRTLALTDEEKREARATDPRAAELIDRLDGLPPEMMERLHGAIRYLEPGVGPVSNAPAGPAGAAAAEGPGAGQPGAGYPGMAQPAGNTASRFTTAGPFPGAAAADDIPVFQNPVRPLVGFRGRLVGLAGDRPRGHRRGRGGPGQHGHHAAWLPAGRRPGPVPGGPAGRRRSGPARRGRARARGRQPGQRSGGRIAAQPWAVPLLRPRRTRAGQPADARTFARTSQSPGTRARGGTEMISRIVTAVVIAVALAALVQSLPDVKRYLELRDM